MEDLVASRSCLLGLYTPDGRYETVIFSGGTTVVVDDEHWLTLQVGERKWVRGRTYRVATEVNVLGRKT